MYLKHVENEHKLNSSFSAYIFVAPNDKISITYNALKKVDYVLFYARPLGSMLFYV